VDTTVIRMDVVDISKTTVVAGKEHEVDIVEMIHLLVATVVLAIVAAMLGQEAAAEGEVEAVVTTTNLLMMCPPTEPWLLSRTIAAE
jgi:hypothetical protein